MCKRFPNRFLLHRCDQDSHYHLILKQAEGSVYWPFWSKEAGLKLVLFARDSLLNNKETSPEDIKFIDNELDRIREEIITASKVQKRRPNGKFAGGFKMPTEFLTQEGYIAESWSSFRRGERNSVSVVHSNFSGHYVFPLYCDFFKRSEPKPEEALTCAEWSKLAEKSAQNVTMVELGIVLETVE